VVDDRGYTFTSDTGDQAVFGNESYWGWRLYVLKGSDETPEKKDDEEREIFRVGRAQFAKRDEVTGRVRPLSPDEVDELMRKHNRTRRSER
jgi:hypothetical protein